MFKDISCVKCQEIFPQGVSPAEKLQVGTLKLSYEIN
jgi:hypothetical protein